MTDVGRLARYAALAVQVEELERAVLDATSEGAAVELLRDALATRARMLELCGEGPAS